MGFQIQTNLLHYYRNLLKKKDGNGTSTSLQNIVNTMKISRNGKVCGENFSYLNFGSIPKPEGLRASTEMWIWI